VETPLTVEFDSKTFSLLAIQKACYRFSNIASFELQVVLNGGYEQIRVVASPLTAKSEIGMEFLSKQLRNEALDQQLREEIRAQTEGVRNLVLAHAFSKTGLIAPDGSAPRA
jgi:His-Xaa-Ser system protein HxsD